MQQQQQQQKLHKIKYKTSYFYGMENNIYKI